MAAVVLLRAYFRTRSLEMFYSWWLRELSEGQSFRLSFPRTFNMQCCLTMI